MPKNEITSAIQQICEEKNIPYDSVIETIEQALAAAYRKDFGEKNQNIKTKFNPETRETRVFDVKTVVEDVPEEELESDEEKELVPEKKSKGTEKLKLVTNNSPACNAVASAGRSLAALRVVSRREITGDEEDKKKESSDKKEGAKKGQSVESTKSDKSESVESTESVEADKPKFNPRTDIQLSDAKKIKKSYKVGDEIKTALKIPAEFGRMAAQTAKQVIIQRLREAERDVLYQEFKEKEGQVVTGIVQRREGRLVLIDLGTTTAIIPPDQQVATENYNSGQRYRVYISEVRETSKGPEIIASRTHSEIVKQLFKVEVPEITSDTVEIKAISREAGSRSKVAVYTDDDSIDPIGSCVGQRGTRIQTIITELGGEKIDIIEYSDDPDKFISNALSPAKVVSVKTNAAGRIAKVKVKPDQLSLAIGKAGQNVRLAAKLTGWKIDIEEAAPPGEKSKDSGEKKEKEESTDKETSNKKLEIRDDNDKAVKATESEEIKGKGELENQETEDEKSKSEEKETSHPSGGHPLGENKEIEGTNDDDGGDDNKAIKKSKSDDAEEDKTEKEEKKEEKKEAAEDEKTDKKKEKYGTSPEASAKGEE